MLAGQMRLLLVAVQALTRLPVRVAYRDGDLRLAARYFPLVGAGVGLVAALVFVGAAQGLPGWVAAVLSLAATLLLTGALHEDGLADCCDGLLGGRTPADALRIMRDSRIGAYGTLGLVVVTGAKLGCVAELADPWALVAAHVVSRAWMAALPAALPYARTQGMAAGVAAPGWVGLVVAGVSGLAALLLLGPRAGAALGMSGLVAVAVALYARRRIGGYTGDVLGATQQLTEVAVLLAELWHAG